MALPAYAPEVLAPAERLHYFHPLRAGIAALLIIAADLGLTFWVGGGHSASLTARTSLLVVLLLAGIGRTFQPRTLSADATEIRWKKMFEPAQTVPRHKVAAIQYMTTAQPLAARYYFVDREGNALLRVDRFTPARMLSFASFLGVPMRPVAAAPAPNASADAAEKANAISGSRRSGIVAMSICAAITLAATVGAVFWIRYDGAELAAYERAPLCERPAADPLGCRFDVAAVVTALPTTSRGHIDVRLLSDVPRFPRRDIWVRIMAGAVPDPGFGVGDTVQIEMFDGRTMAINGARTDGFATLASNASWLLVAGTGGFFLVCLVAMLLCWKGPDSWFVERARPAAPSKPTLDDPPVVTDQPGPKEKPGAIERVPLPDIEADPTKGWPTLIQTPGFDLARDEADVSAVGIPDAGERLLARAPVHYYLVPNSSSMLFLTDRRLVLLGPKRMEIPRGRIALIAYWRLRDSIAVTYRTMDGAHGILLTGPQLVLTGGPTTDMHRLFEAMTTALTRPDTIREPVVIVRRIGAWGRWMKASSRLTHQLWLAWAG